MVLGTEATRPGDSIAYAQAAKEAGADALLIAMPAYACPTEREFARHALAVDLRLTCR